MRGGRWPALAVAVAVVIGAGACGGDESGGGAPATKAAWQEVYGAVVTAVDTALDRTQAATKAGEPIGIRTSCEGLRDSVAEAMQTPPVPDGTAEQAFRSALDSVAQGAADCLRSVAQGDTRLLEKSIVEVREARLAFDTAKVRLRA